MSTTGTIPARSSPRVRRGAIGVLIQDGRFLMIRRAPGVVKGGCWCFPGGHAEKSETSRQAIVRELAEELGLSVEAVERLGSVRVDMRCVLAVWRVRHCGGTLRPDSREIEEARWVEARRLRSLSPGLPSNETVFKMLGV